jgi:hypothetical protein
VENWRRAVTGLSTTGAAHTPTISLTVALIACISASRSPVLPFATPKPRLARSCAGRKILTRRKWPVHATNGPPFLFSNSLGNNLSSHRGRPMPSLPQNNTTRRYRPASRVVNSCYHGESRRSLGLAAQPRGLTIRDPRQGSWCGVFRRPAFLYTTCMSECCPCAPALLPAPTAMT